MSDENMAALAPPPPADTPVAPETIIDTLVSPLAHQDETAATTSADALVGPAVEVTDRAEPTADGDVDATDPEQVGDNDEEEEDDDEEEDAEDDDDFDIVVDAGDGAAAEGTAAGGAADGPIGKVRLGGGASTSRWQRPGFTAPERGTGAVVPSVRPGGVLAMLPTPTMQIGTNQRSVYDIEFGKLTEKPWLERGADITEYFNYGFNEDTWKLYCERQVQMRLEASMMAKIKTIGGGASAATVAAAAAQVLQQQPIQQLPVQGQHQPQQPNPNQPQQQRQQMQQQLPPPPAMRQVQQPPMLGMRPGQVPQPMPRAVGSAGGPAGMPGMPPGAMPWQQFPMPPGNAGRGSQQFPFPMPPGMPMPPGFPGMLPGAMPPGAMPPGAMPPGAMPPGMGPQQFGAPTNADAKNLGSRPQPGAGCNSRFGPAPQSGGAPGGSAGGRYGPPQQGGYNRDRAGQTSPSQGAFDSRSRGGYAPNPGTSRGPLSHMPASGSRYTPREDPRRDDRRGGDERRDEDRKRSHGRDDRVDDPSKRRRW
jgi:pre-mRNA 3'-end-processing factor FIP1